MSPIALLSHWLDLYPERHAPLQDERLEQRRAMMAPKASTWLAGLGRRAH